MTESKRKVVQTEMDRDSYDLFKEVAEAKGLTLKEGARQAVIEWAAREANIEDDVLFDLSVTLKAGHATDSTRLDEVVYGRRGRR